MARARIVGIAAALVGFVYAGTTTLDSALADEMRLLRLLHVADLIVNIPAMVVVLSLLFGGLPLAIAGLLLDRRWRDVPVGRRLRVPYVVLVFQIVSMTLSAFGLAMMVEALLWALSQGMAVRASDWRMPGYFTVQILASIAVIPVWRRLVASASLRPTFSLNGDRASRA